MTSILISGGGGFVGHHLVRYVLETTDWDVHLPLRKSHIQYPRLDWLNSLIRGFWNRVQAYQCHIEFEGVLARIPHPDYIVHLAAKTKIAESITAPGTYVHSNIGSTLQMLEYAREAAPQLKRFLYFSTDEVFGPTPNPEFRFHEWSRYDSRSPYAATKAASEELCLAWASTYGVPVVITHAQNLIGERQSPEKFLPSVVRAGMTGTKVDIYSDFKTQHQAMRNYLHARDAASAVLFLLQENVKIREKYNIATLQEYSNLDIVQMVGRIMNKSIKWNEVDSRTVRPGFFIDHGLNSLRLAEMGWQPLKSLAENLADTVFWMTQPENLHWIAST